MNHLCVNVYTFRSFVKQTITALVLRENTEYEVWVAIFLHDDGRGTILERIRNGHRAL